jgi:hypothetical protein
VVAYITHPVLSGAAIERISKSVLDELVVTDTIPLSDEATRVQRIRQLTVSGLLAETIRRISDDDSVSSLYVDFDEAWIDGGCSGTGRGPGRWLVNVTGDEHENLF